MITKLCPHGRSRTHMRCPECDEEERQKMIEGMEVAALGKNYVREYLFDSWRAWPSNLRDTISWLQSKYEQVPEEYRDAATFDVYAKTHSIYYDRLETPEEHADRESRARAATDDQTDFLGRVIQSVMIVVIILAIITLAIVP